jgi:hypothetical protein
MHAVTAASDDLEKVGAVFLQLKLVIDRGQSKRESVLVGQCSARQRSAALAEGCGVMRLTSHAGCRNDPAAVLPVLERNAGRGAALPIKPCGRA